jgi:nucleotide-binding universal stress UspA family protein
MTVTLVGTNGPETSEILCEYLEATVSEGDRLYVINSRQTGDSTEAIRKGKEGVDLVAERLGDRVPVETHQFVRGNHPKDELLDFAAERDVDEIVIGIRRRSPSNRLVFGSMSQKILLNADRPVVAIPLDE